MLTRRHGDPRRWALATQILAVAHTLATDPLVLEVEYRWTGR